MMFLKEPTRYSERWKRLRQSAVTASRMIAGDKEYIATTPTLPLVRVLVSPVRIDEHALVQSAGRAVEPDGAQRYGALPFVTAGQASAVASGVAYAGIVGHFDDIAHATVP